METPASNVFLRTHRVDRLEVETLPIGQRSRLLVHLVHDALGRPVALPVLVLRGVRPGPVVGLTAALHGNELNGIPVLHRLFDRVDPQQLRGTLVGVVVVNLPGYLSRRRLLEPRFDLNHLFPGRDDGNAAQVYAARFLDRIVKHFDYLFDLHTASFGRANSFYVRANLSDDTAARMALLQRPQIILDHSPTDGSLRGTAASLGIPAVTLEIGDPQRFQASYIKRALGGIRAVLSDLGLLPKRRPVDVPEPVVCSSSRWLYTDHGGLLEVFPEVADKVEKDEVVARLTNIFGEVEREYRAPESGIVIGKSVDPVASTGGRILHLGHIEENHPAVIRLRASQDPSASIG
ncbi:MAG: succinylglutamate desuccinylase/aspartoacylase family protein [bacterium]